MKRKRKGITSKRRFEVLHRDSFKCRYCGSEPGNDSLHVDHLIPVSKGGSDKMDNLVAACKPCNSGRSNRILFPRDLIVGKDDQGWDVIFVRGIWSIKASPDIACVCGSIHTHDPLSSFFEYYFEIDRAYESDWERHIKEKCWPQPHFDSDFFECLNHARNLVAQ
jgi:hypothetical protein